MAVEKTITIPHIPDETRVAVEKLLKNPDSPFTSLEDCIASLMEYRMHLKALGEVEKVRILEDTYHLKDISVVYTPRNISEEK